MNGTDRELEAALAGIVDEGRRSLSPHALADELVAYRDGALAADAAVRIEDHLVLCEECAELLLDLESFAGLDEGAPLATAAEVEAVVRGVEARAGQMSGGVGGAGAAGDAGLPRRLLSRGRLSRLPRRWTESLAASFLVATVGLSAWVVQLRSQVDDLSRPQPNAPVVQLSFSTPRGEGSAPEVLVLAPGTRHVALVVTAPPPQRFSEYRVEVARADGALVVSERGLTRSEPGAFLSLILPSRDLRPGDYQVRLFGLSEDGDEPIGEIPLRVVESASGP